MKFTATALTVALAHVAFAAPAAEASQLSVIGPAAVAECTLASLLWAGGVGPYSLTIKGTGSAHVVFATFKKIKGTSHVWTANATAGTLVQGHLTDSTGATASTDPFQVQSIGGNTSCIGK